LTDISISVVGFILPCPPLKMFAFSVKVTELIAIKSNLPYIRDILTYKRINI
jgi:hypothetical protein